MCAPVGKNGSADYCANTETSIVWWLINENLLDFQNCLYNVCYNRVELQTQWEQARLFVVMVMKIHGKH